MALKAENDRHQLQIDAGTEGRKRGHKFEAVLSDAINNIYLASENNRCKTSYVAEDVATFAYDASHLFEGNPAELLIKYIEQTEGIIITNAHAYWLGGLATSGEGDVLLDVNGNPITGSKSDVLIKIETNTDSRIVGISVKTCNKKTPTNDQMYFSTARAFCKLLCDNGIIVSDEAQNGMSQFCGDAGYRPLDLMSEYDLKKRLSDPRRYYWEELSYQAKKEWADIFTKNQDAITKLLFQKAYKNDPYPPEYLLHQTVKYDDFNNCQVAIFTIDEIVQKSREHCGYVLSTYKIHKGTYKGDPNEHEAPRFGFIQFQRGGQKQHPTQLQFNLKAGYFRHI